MECDLPVLEEKECAICGHGTVQVPLTPPGDVRPAFPFDIEMVRRQINAQFGAGTGQVAIPEGRIVLLNRCPATDRMDEVVMNGRVIGALVFDVDREALRFIPRMAPAKAIASSGRLERGWVKVDKGAVKAIEGGANALAPGIIAAHEAIGPGDETIILSPDGEVLAVGPARMTASEMEASAKGVAVKSRWYKTSKGADVEAPYPIEDHERTWEDVLKANGPYLEKRIAKAVAFIKRTVARYDLPVAVSFSGGKDSLATLLLVLEAGVKGKVLFVDTGLELKETIENVQEICKAKDLELLEEKAGEAFWEALPRFGPPARDFRWCCKTCKLGPVSRLIKGNFPEGVLTFIGQRSYESMQRKGKGPVWRNPWVASQVGASPIQDWTALLVWIYLFSHTAEANPLYAEGFARIGCWLCPASDLGDMALLKGHVDMDRWETYLRSYAKERGLPETWLSKALWRWRKLPKGLKRYAEAVRPTRTPDVPVDGPLCLVMAEGYSPCTGGVSVEGTFTRPLDMEKVGNMLWTVGSVEELTDVPGALFVDGKIDVYPEGAILVRGRDEKEVRKRSEAVRRAVLRAMECVGCGVCLGRCEQDAITLVNGRAIVDPETCVSCGKCSEKCPVTDFPAGTNDQ
jgi:phosphoadenosine phosphosulfate reductase